ncbi:MAG: agmatine deiminase family protein [Bernardetiaceae bacterium]|nr:agmatine deiminase family protein [Bernardetiaceae bacterium]
MLKEITGKTPKSLGYYFPAEWSRHRATWLSWPHKEASWPGKIDAIFPVYAEFVKALASGEQVHINVNDQAMKHFATEQLQAVGANLEAIHFHFFPTNDAWCRDHGPAFVINPEAEAPKAIVKWNYNAWGGKYPPYDLDNQIPVRIAEYLDLPLFRPDIIMEGGAVDFNGEGTVLTTTSCLLNPNRNPHLSQEQIEWYLAEYYGIEQVLWLEEGIAGDDTDGHVDDIARFVNSHTVVAVVEHNSTDENYAPLQNNLKKLSKMRLLNGKLLDVIELPMPEPVVYQGMRLPASYANFYIANAVVVVPTYRCQQDDQALEILQKCFPERRIIGLDCTDIIWGLGAFHCLSQQEPEVV